MKRSLRSWRVPLDQEVDEELALHVELRVRELVERGLDPKILAVVGVFGVLAYSVQQRTSEFGVRIALGASAANVLRLVLSSAGGVIGIGIAVGLIAAAVVSRSMSAFLFGVQPLDPMTFLIVPVVLIATAAIAVAAPAWRATRTDPVEAFRAE